MSGPSQATVKRLFSVSGNRCAFPRCTQPLVDAASGKVTGRICHIRAQSPGGPRYDERQTEEERQGFANLILMCPAHHDVIDADPESYTVARLEEIKARHEARHASGLDPGDDVTTLLLQVAPNSTVLGGSIVTSINQLGGQTAHSIVNVGGRARTISPEAATALESLLGNYPAEDFSISVQMSGDGECLQLAQTLERILMAGGWRSLGLGYGVYHPPVVGIFVQTPAPDPISSQPGLTAFIKWMHAIGFSPQAAKGQPIKEMQIIVGPQPTG